MNMTPSKSMRPTDADRLRSTMVGGDNASRGIALGMVLGAYKGVEAIPKAWRETLDQWDYCDELLSKLPLLKR